MSLQSFIHYLYKSSVGEGGMEPTTKFLCERCHHESSCKGNLIKHLTKKNLCPPAYSDKSREYIVSTLIRVSDKPKTFQCDFCDKAFSTIQGKCQHRKICPKHPDRHVNNILMTMQKKIEELEIELKRQKCENHGSTVNNNTNTNIQNQIINNTFVVNNFGNETIPQFSTEFLNNCILNPSKGLTRIIEKIHYNEELPENHNLRYKSTKNKTLEKFIDQNWHECDASNTLDELIKKGYRILSTYYGLLEQREGWYDDEVTASMYGKFMFLGDKKSRDYSAVKRDLLLLVKDKTLFLLAPNGSQINQEEINEINKELQEELDESIL